MRGAGGRALAREGTAWSLESGTVHLQTQPSACRHTTAGPVPALGAVAVCTGEREGGVCSWPPMRSPRSLRGALLLLTVHWSLSAVRSFIHSVSHSVKPTKSLLRDRASQHLPGQWLWARVHRRAGSQGWAPRLADDRKPLVPTLWTVPGETLTPAFSPASRPSAGRCPGRWTTRHTPGEWVSGAPSWWWCGVPGCPRVSRVAAPSCTQPPFPFSAVGRWETGRIFSTQAAVSPSTNRSSG